MTICAYGIRRKEHWRHWSTEMNKHHWDGLCHGCGPSACTLPTSGPGIVVVDHEPDDGMQDGQEPPPEKSIQMPTMDRKTPASTQVWPAAHEREALRRNARFPGSSSLARCLTTVYQNNTVVQMHIKRKLFWRNGRPRAARSQFVQELDACASVQTGEG